jgi:hypothetical protein
MLYAFRDAIAELGEMLAIDEQSDSSLMSEIIDLERS